MEYSKKYTEKYNPLNKYICTAATFFYGEHLVEVRNDLGRVNIPCLGATAIIESI